MAAHEWEDSDDIPVIPEEPAGLPPYKRINAALDKALHEIERLKKENKRLRRELKAKSNKKKGKKRG